jgi:hypothetical protein
MPEKKRSQEERALQWLRNRNVSRVDKLVAAEGAAALPEIKERAWRDAFRTSGLPLDPLVEGVRQDDLGNLQRTLSALAAAYEAGEPALKQEIRRVVMTARQHADWASRGKSLSEAQRREKLEILLWIRTWLENPPLFHDWAAIRLRARVNCSP